MGNSNSNKIQEIIRDLVWFCVFAILISIVIIAIPAFGSYGGRYAIFSDILIGSAISFFCHFNISSQKDRFNSNRSSFTVLCFII